MPQSLLIAVRFHEGRYHGQADGFDDDHGWPPSPGRLFQALVAGAARGATLHAEDQRALEWLEGLDPPRIAAPAIRHGRAVKRFVPNNDLDSVGGDPARVGEIRVGKQWRPCFFDQGIPILFAWRFESGAAEAERICAISTRLYQLGRGIDMAWASGRVLDEREAEVALASHPGALRTPGGAGTTATPCPGTLASLVQKYRRNREKLTTEGTGRKSRQLFTQPPRASFAHTGYDAPARCLHFELRTSEGGFAPQALASAAPLLTGLRDGAAQRLQEAVPASAPLFEKADHRAGRRPAGPCATGSPRAHSIRRHRAHRSFHPEAHGGGARRSARSGSTILAWAFAGLQACDPETGESWNARLVSTDDAPDGAAILRGRHASTGASRRSLSPVRRGAGWRRRTSSPQTSAAARNAPRPGASSRHFAMPASRPGPPTSGCSANRSNAERRQGRALRGRFEVLEACVVARAAPVQRDGFGTDDDRRRQVLRPGPDGARPWCREQQRRVRLPAPWRTVNSGRRATGPGPFPAPCPHVARARRLGWGGSLVLRSRAGRPIGQRGPSRPHVPGGGRRWGLRRIDHAPDRCRSLGGGPQGWAHNRSSATILRPGGEPAHRVASRPAGSIRWADGPNP